MEIVKQKNYRILLLSDLHFCAPGTESWFLNRIFPPGHSPETIGHCLPNIKMLFEFILSSNLNELPNHVIILGDITTRGLKIEFQQAKSTLLEFQKELKKKSKLEQLDNEELDSSLFTIIPGNHDLTKYTNTTFGFIFDTVLGFAWKYIDIFVAFFGIEIERLKRMKTLLKAFDQFFGNTLSHNGDKPISTPELFGSFQKVLPDTNISIVPFNTCAPLPVTALGWNAVGKLSKTQRRNLSVLGDDDSSLFSRFLRIGIMHHFPLPVPIKSAFGENFLDLLKANRAMVSLYGSNKLSAIICGHKHTDFIWTPSANLPNTELCMPIITIGSCTFSAPKQNTIRYYTLEIQASNLKECDFQKDFITLKSHEWEPSRKPNIIQSFLPKPKTFNHITGITKRIVKDAQRRFTKERVIFFLDFFDPLENDVLKYIESPYTQEAGAKLEISRLGVRIYGSTSDSGDEINFLVKNDRYIRNVKIILSFRQLIPCGINTKIRIYYEDVTDIISISDDMEQSIELKSLMLQKNAVIRLLYFSPNDENKILLHYLAVLGA